MKTPKGTRPKRGRVEIRYQYRGETFTEVLDLSWTPASIEEAARIRDERLRRLRAGLPPIEGVVVVAPRARSRLTFAQVSQEYLDHTIACDADDPFRLKLSSHNSARELLNLFWLDALGREPVERITIETLKSAVRGVKWSSLKRKRNAFGAVRQVFAYALDEDRGYITSNPAKTLSVATRRGNTKKPAPDCYAPADRDTLLAWLKENTDVSVYTYFLIAFYSGMRTGELLALTWADYDDDSFNVEKAIVRGQLTTTKTNETRRVLMPAWVCAVINATAVAVQTARAVLERAWPALFPRPQAESTLRRCPQGNGCAALGPAELSLET